MRPGRETDARIAKEVFGYNVWAKGKVLHENHPKGDRPLRNYSGDLEAAWEVVEHMKITLLPVEEGQWFAFVGPQELAGWKSPQDLLQFLEAGQFNGCGAAVGTKIPAIVCESALKAVEKRQAKVSETVAATETSAGPLPLH